MHQHKPVQYREYIRKVENFPKEGVTFYDIAPLLGNGAIFGNLIQEMAEPLHGKVTKIVGFDARGFLFGGAMAAHLGIGFTMLRKPGKLPGKTTSVSYDLEYGNSSLEMQTDAVDKGEKVALVDDIIATGGTALAGIELAQKCGANVVEFCSVLDLCELGGSDKITAAGIAVRSIIIC
jgi:adenine phosphoribosyltransferase